jgi:sigma-B regulation protein RsbU (phosphoserine phosphatase)
VTQVRAMLRMAVRLGADLDAAFHHINDQLAADLPDNRFVTAFMGVLDTQNHRVIYHSGGQGPLLHFHAATGQCEWRGSSNPPMGMMAGLDRAAPRKNDLAPGDILALITDGSRSERTGCRL